MNSKKRIVFYLTDNEYNRLEQRAQTSGFSINAFAKQKTLEETDCVRLRRETASVMAKLYYWAEQIPDPAARAYMREGGDRLCQSLK